jgi:hypothetical protein
VELDIYRGTMCPMLSIFMLALASPAASPTAHTFYLHATGKSKSCFLTEFGELVPDQRLQTMAKADGKTAVVDTDLRASRRCIASTILRLKKQGIKVLEVTRNGTRLNWR